ncbi:MAG TPA: transporter [Vicinamibacterales bacterium]|jgi:hypothetical protein
MKTFAAKKFLTRVLISTVATLSLPTCVQAQDTPVSSPGRDAPAGVMNSMLHREGEWMASVRLMTMSMSGSRDGRTDLSDAEVFNRGYAQSPQNMTMLMPALDVMYGLTERITLSATLPFVFNSMDMRMMDDSTFTMKASGVGDLRAGAMFGLYRGRRQDLHFYAGLQFPLGSVTARDDMPDCPNCKVDYPMQPGSGTFDVTPGLTWVLDEDRWSWGANWLSVLRTGDNSEGYRFGNRHDLSAWGSRQLNRHVSASVRLSGSIWENVHGADPDFDPTMSPTQDPAAQGGKRMDLSVGMAFKPTVDVLRRGRLAVEVGHALAQSLDGPQLATGWTSSFLWQLWWY